MRTIKTQNIMDPKLNCNHDPIQSNGFLVCQNCGLILDRIYSHFLFKKDKNKKQDNSNLPNRLTKVNKFALKDDSPESRIYKILLRINRRLLLPEVVKVDAYRNYLKLKKSNLIKNNVMAIAYCVWDSIKEFNIPISLSELSNIFREEGHWVTNRLLVRVGIQYSSFLHSLHNRQIQISTPFKYLPKLINKLRQNKIFISNKLKKKKIICYQNVENFLLELENQSQKIITTLSFQWEQKGMNPLLYTGAILYLAGEILAIKHNYKRFLTQKFIAKCIELNYESIKHIYGIFLRKYNPNAIIKKRGDLMKYVRIEYDLLSQEKLKKLMQYLLEEKILFNIWDLSELKNQ